jgi:uncharacterized repeat protein (TIGR01451 family)
VPVVSLQQQPSGATVNPGQTLSYQLVVNVAGSTAFNLVVTDNLPADTAFGSFTTGPVGTQSGTQLSWNLGNVPVGAVTLSFTVSVSDSAPNGFTLSNGGSLSYTGLGSPIEANSADVVVIVLTPTPVPTNSFTPTSTSTPTFTNTWTPTATNTSTVTVTPTSTVGSTVPVLYPNPVDGTQPVTVYVPGVTGTVTVQVYTTAFRMVLSKTYTVTSSNPTVSFDLVDSGNNPLANGLYYVVVTTSKARTVLKLMVLR